MDYIPPLPEYRSGIPITRPPTRHYPVAAKQNGIGYCYLVEKFVLPALSPTRPSRWVRSSICCINSLYGCWNYSGIVMGQNEVEDIVFGHQTFEFDTEQRASG